MTDSKLNDAFSNARIGLTTYIASLITATSALFAFRNDLYLGAPYVIEVPRFIISELIFSLFLSIFWSLFCLWPLVLFITSRCIKLIKRHPIFIKFYVWALTGALLGIPSMFFYAFFLRLGYTKWLELSATGMIYGLICASLSWGLIRLQIRNRTV